MELKSLQKTTASVVGFHYKGAKDSRFRDYGNPPAPSKTEEQVLTQADRLKAIGRLYDLSRNNEIVGAILEAFVSSMGSVQFRATLDPIIEDFFYDWFEDIDVAGEDLSSIIRQSLIQLLLSGEVFVNMTNTGQIQLIEAAQIFSHKNPTANEVQGIIRNAQLKVTGYRLNGETILQAENVLHIYRKNRPSQLRGIPWLLSGVPALQDLSETIEARNIQIKNSAMLLGIHKSPDPFEDGAVQREGTVKAGSMLELSSEETFELLESTTNADDFSAYLRSRITQILAVIGLPYEVVFGFSSNYASSKGTRTQYVAKIKEVRKFLDSKLLAPLMKWKLAKEGKKPLANYAFQWSGISALEVGS